ncbi:hypothetical protein N7G274_004117 [Stereocaulon virgatum]|uniref:Uncharacterized protein n=1 Tax=Stereocaulon virgatum TaxID=373712 RepID=A0ABR4AI14_9LECA
MSLLASKNPWLYLMEKKKDREPQAPPPSPKLYPQLLSPNINMHDLDQRIKAHVSIGQRHLMAQPFQPTLVPEAGSRGRVLFMDNSSYKISPLRRVTSADNADEMQNEEDRDDDDDDDDATATDFSSSPSPRCSGATLLNDAATSEGASSKRRFTLPSRTGKQQRQSQASGDAPQSRPLIPRSQIFSPITDISTVSPDVAYCFPRSMSRKAKSYPGRGSYYLSRSSPKGPAAEDRSHWSESDENNHGEKKGPSTFLRIAAFPSRGKRFRRKLSDLFCGS